MAADPKYIQRQFDHDEDIREMTYNDLGAVIDIETAAYVHPWTVGIFRDCVRVGYSCWVIEKENKIVAYGIIMLAAGEAHILNVCVHPDVQHQGIGRFILNFLLDKAKQSNAGMVLLEVRESNHAAISLYESENFNQLGIRTNYYPTDNGREDAIIFAIQVK